LIGVSPVTLGNWERGQFKELPKKGMLEAIAHHCGVPVEWMATGFPDAATRFATTARTEAQRRNEHPQQGEEDQAGEGGPQT
jgi:transcriptional regulator with XRE-family HTH domain